MVKHLHVYALAAVGFLVTLTGENHMRLLQQETGQRKCLIADLHELTKERMEVVSLKEASS